MRPRSSIQTPVGTLANWNAELTAWFGSTSVVNVAFAVSYHRPAAASPPVTTAYHALQSQVAQARWKAFLSRQGTPG